MRRIVSLHYREIDETLLQSALTIFYELRERGYEKSPATSELLNWLGALQQAGLTPADKGQIPFPGILLKRTGDILAYRGEKEGRNKRSARPF
jgi:MoxR-like ATPase